MELQKYRQLSELQLVFFASDDSDICFALQCDFDVIKEPKE